MANEQNLVSFKDMTVKRQREIAVMGGLANKNNPKTKLAARLRELKKKGLTDENAVRLVDIFETANMGALDIWMFLDQIKMQTDKPMVMVQLAGQYINLHKQIHGEKIKSENTNTNININIDMLKYQELIKKYEKEE